MPSILPAIFSSGVVDRDDDDNNSGYDLISSTQKLLHHTIPPHLPPVRQQLPLTVPLGIELHQDNPIGFPMHDESQAMIFIIDWFNKLMSWQKQVFLCGLTKQCSRNILEQLISSLEPVFHRDFTVSYRGRYPVTPFSRNKKTMTTISPKLLKKDTNTYVLHKKKNNHNEFKRAYNRKKESSDLSNSSGLNNATLIKRFNKPRQSVHTIPLMSTRHSSLSLDTSTRGDKTARVNWTKLRGVLMWGSCLLVHANDLLKREELILALADPTAGFLPHHNKIETHHHQSTLSSARWSTYYPESSAISHTAGDGTNIPSQYMIEDNRTHRHTNNNSPSKRKISKRRQFKQSLNVIWEWLDNKADSTQLDILLHIMKQCNLSDINFLTNCLINRSRDQYDINCLPDNILLYIFSHLAPTELSVLTQVCKRWRYLSDLSDIWMLKCNELGVRYGVTDINRLILTHSNSVESIDWKTAYRELYTILKSAQLTAYQHNLVDTTHSHSLCDNRDSDTDTLSDDYTTTNRYRHCLPSTTETDEFGLKSIDKKLRCERKIHIDTRNRVSASTTTETDQLILFQAQEANYYTESRRSSISSISSVCLPVRRKKHTLTLARTRTPRVTVETTTADPESEDDECITDNKNIVDSSQTPLHQTEVSGQPLCTTPSHSTTTTTTVPLQIPTTTDKQQQQLYHTTTTTTTDQQIMSDIRDSIQPSHHHILSPSSSSSSCCSHHTPSPPLIMSECSHTVSGHSTPSMTPNPTPVPPPTGSHGVSPPLNTHQLGRRPDSDDNHLYASMDVRLCLQPAMDICMKSECQYALRWKKPHENSSNIEGYETIVKSIFRVRRLKCHMDAVLTIWSDHKRIVSGSVDRTVRVCDARSGRSLRKMYGHMGRVTAVFFNKNLILSGSWDMTVMAWHPIKFTQLAVMTGHKGSVSSVQADLMYIVSGAHDKTVRVWSADTFHCITVITGHTDAVTQVVLKNRLVVSSSWDRTLRLCTVPDGNCIRVFEGHSDAVTSVQWCGSLLLSGSLNGCVYFWNEDTGVCEAAIQAHDESVLALDYFKSRFFTASSDSVVMEWDVLSMTCIRSLHGHKGPVRDLRISDDMLVTCSDDGDIRVWDLTDPQLLGADDDDAETEYIHTVNVDDVK